MHSLVDYSYTRLQVYSVKVETMRKTQHRGESGKQRASPYTLNFCSMLVMPLVAPS